MGQEDLHVLSNHFQAMRLVSLHTWSDACAYPDRDAHGPYLIVQRAYAPSDPTTTADEFVLGRTGEWVSMGAFLRLSEADRREAYLFPTAAEVMAVVGGLPPMPVITGDASETTHEDAPGQPGSNDLRAVLESAPRTGSPVSSPGPW